MAWQKRISAPNWWPIERKTHKFITTVRGPHSDALPLQVLVRDVLKLADTAKEAKKIITAGSILVDGHKRKDIKFGVGAMDMIEIPTLKKTWRAVPRNGLTFVETSGNDAKLKMCKIIGKKHIRGGKTQLNLFGGRNILSDKEYSTKDSVVLEVPSNKIVDHIKFAEGNIALVMKGKNDGMIAKIKEIDRKNKRIWMAASEDKFEVPIDSVMMLGKDKPAVKIE